MKKVGWKRKRNVEKERTVSNGDTEYWRGPKGRGLSV